MRSKSRTTLLALVTVLALSALASASASAALPEFTTTSKFLGAFGESEFKWDGEAWKYANGDFSGEMSSHSTVAKVSLSFTIGSIGCNTGKEELALTGIKGRLGYLNKEKKEVGLLLGEPIYTECTWHGTTREHLVDHYLGDIVAKITPVNTKTKRFKLTLTVTGGGEQEFTKFEGEEADVFKLGEYKCGKLLEKEACGGTGEQLKLSVASMELNAEKETEIEA
jgi:hypothetical protein